MDEARPGDKAEPDYDAFLKHVGERIRTARRRAGITQSQLAKAIGATQPYMVAVESGENLTLRSLARISAVLKVEPVSLLSSGEFTTVVQVDNSNLVAELARRAAHDGSELSKLLLQLQAIIPSGSPQKL